MLSSNYKEVTVYLTKLTEINHTYSIYLTTQLPEIIPVYPAPGDNSYLSTQLPEIIPTCLPSSLR